MPNGENAEYQRNEVENMDNDWSRAYLLRRMRSHLLWSRIQQPFKNCWVLNAGTNIHICNERSRIINLDISPTEFKVGNDQTMQVQGYGQAWNQTRKHKRKPTRRVLSNVAYVPGFHTNMVSIAQLEERNI